MPTFPFPPVSVASNGPQLLDNTGISTSPLTGATKTRGRGGNRLRMTLTLPPERDPDRKKIQGFLGRLNGRSNRISLRDHAYTGPRGAISVSELLDPSPLSTSGWQVQVAANGTISDVEDALRWTCGPTTTNTVIEAITGNGIGTIVAGRSYAAVLNLALVRPDDQGTEARSEIRFRTTGQSFTSAIVDGSVRLSVAALVDDIADFEFRIFPNRPDDFRNKAQVDYYQNCSIARCFLVDHLINELLHSDDLSQTEWTKINATITTDATAGPRGESNADELVEDTTVSDEHRVRQGVTTANVTRSYTGSCHIKENTQQRIRLRISDGSGNGGLAFFDANTGSITSSADVGTGMNTYASIHDVGNGWFRCRVTTVLPASTEARMDVNLCDGASETIVYTGDGTSGLYLTDLQMQEGSQPGRYTRTTTAAASTAQQGSQIYVKALDEDTEGQLEQGDQVEINGQLLIVTASLDGDESGNGLLHVYPQLRSSVDEDPVILHRPHGTFMLANPTVGWQNLPGSISTAQIEFIEDIAV